MKTMAKKSLTELEKELSLALECASICNRQSSCASWGNPSPFQDVVNRLLVSCGRKPTPLPTLRDPEAQNKVFEELLKQWAKEQGFETWSQDHASVMRNLAKWLSKTAAERSKAK